jgi:hypothetical protein
MHSPLGFTLQPEEAMNIISTLPLMEQGNEKEEIVTADDIEKETLKPVTKAKSKKDKELQEWEVSQQAVD